MAEMLLWGMVLLVVFLTATFAIVRFSRRYRAYLLRRTPPPTANDDVWMMHRLPESDEDHESAG